MKWMGLLVGLLATPIFVLSALDARGWKSDRQARARMSLIMVLLFTGPAHFWASAAMVQMLPLWIPARLAIVYATGVLELLAVAGLLSEKWRAFTGRCLIVFLLAVFPANIYAAFTRIPVGGQDAGPAFLLLRAPLQFILIGWTWWCTKKPEIPPAGISHSLAA